MDMTRPGSRRGAHDTGRRARRPAAGVTLVELLVVVAIAALVLTMLVPSLGRGRALARAGVCRHQLRQLWEAFHDDAARGFPDPRYWLNFVDERKLTRLVRCPSDAFEGGGELALADVYLVQDPGGLTFYPVLEIIRNGPMGLFQCEVFNRGGSVYEIWIGNYVPTPDLPRSDADAAVRVVLGKTATVEILDPPGDGGPGDTYQCSSDHWLCHGPNMGTPNWKQDVKRRLTGMSYHKVDPPYRATGLPCSYGMNIHVPALGADPTQILLLDYKKLTAEPLADWVGGESQYLDPPRHLGRVNAVFVDGHVHGLWPHELTPHARAWDP